MSYGADGPDALSEDSALRDQDLAGRQPIKYPSWATDEIPIIVNLITAKALGIMVPKIFPQCVQMR